MSALFSHKKRPFRNDSTHDVDEDDNDKELDDDIFFIGKGKKKKSKEAPAIHQEPSSKKAPATSSEEDVVVIDDVDDTPVEVVNTKKPKTRASRRNVDDVIEIVEQKNPNRKVHLSSSDALDIEDFDPAIKELLRKVHQGAKQVSKEAESVPPEPVTQQSSSMTYLKVRSSAQRLEEATLRAKPIVSTTRNSAQALTHSSEREDSESDDDAVVNIKTRLNGQHEYQWRLKVDASFAVLTRRLDKYYGLSPGLLSLVFDGDKLTPDQTPQSLDMEEGDDVLIDVKVDKSLYDQAVATATKK